MTKTRYKVREDNQATFITCTTVNWLPIFADNENDEVIINSLKYMQSRRQLSIYAFVIMKDHLHLIVVSENLSHSIGCFKSYTARLIIDKYEAAEDIVMLKQLQQLKKKYKTDRTYQLWQEGFQPKLIQSRQMMEQKVDYIHHNPVRAGYVEVPEQWKYSSAGDYYTEQKGLLEIITEW